MVSLAQQQAAVEENRTNPTPLDTRPICRPSICSHVQLAPETCLDNLVCRSVIDPPQGLSGTAKLALSFIQNTANLTFQLPGPLSTETTFGLESIPKRWRRELMERERKQQTSLNLIDIYLGRAPSTAKHNLGQIPPTLDWSFILCFSESQA